MFDLYKSLKTYVPCDNEEKKNLELLNKFLNISDNCFSRSNLAGHVTADALIMDKNGNVLLNHHKSLDIWTFFGGHSDGEKDSLNVAKREVKEEAGITEADDFGGKILDIDVHSIPENISKKEPEHIHYNIRFLFVVNNHDFIISDESKEIKWVSFEEAMKLLENTNRFRSLNKAYNVYLRKYSQEEIFDVLNENGEFTGEIATRDMCHKKGLWHRAVYAFILDDNNNILLQKRSPNKKLWPNLWDAPIGGHVDSGEFGRQAIIREAKEELGIEISDDDIKYLVGSTSINEKGDIINKHFNECYLITKSFDISKVKLQEDEVSEIKFFAKDEILKRISNNYEGLTTKIGVWNFLQKILEIYL